MTQRYREFSRTLALVLCLALVLPLLCLQSPSARATENDEEDTRPIIVSLGDSYSSGEGIEPFYGQSSSMSVKKHDYDWLAHRSELAWGGQLTLPGVDNDMHANRGENWYFVAASGAETKHISMDGEQEKKYNRDFQWGTEHLPGQLKVFYETEGLDRFDVDYVTLTMGGNDLGFAKIITRAVLSPDLYPGLFFKLKSKLDHYYDKGGFNDQLIDCYLRIHDAAPNATIVVAGYPKLLDPDGLQFLFGPLEIAQLNSVVEIFNDRIEDTIRQLSDQGLPIVFVSVEEAFEGHGAYADVPYINDVRFGPCDQDINVITAASSYSVHPNARGAQAYASCVQAKINELEGATRDVVLVLDTSSSMDGAPLRETKEAAKEFVSTVIPENASVGVVTYSSHAEIECPFSMSEGYLNGYINDISSGGNTNIEDGLKTAAGMFGEKNSDRNRIIVLMSDGEANEGKTGDELIAYANELKKQGITIYTLGFFQSVGSKSEPQRVMEGIATSGCHYEVENAEDLVFFFGDMAQQISGENYVYIRIACPVDVSVTHNGETLSSAEDDYNTRTSFGTLTFEEGEDSGDRVKILRLRENAAYEVEIVGTGEGTMDYSVGYMDENGEYTEMREIKDVPITEDTVITTGTARTSKTVLNVDSDGDGETDDTYSVGGASVVDAPEEGKTKRDFTTLWLILGGAALVLITALGILLTRRRRRRRERKRAAKLVHSTTTEAGSAVRAGRVFCGGCGAEIPRGAVRCRKCGRPAPKE